MSEKLERRGSAHFEVTEAKDIGKYEGVLMSVRALRAKADAEKTEGRLGGAYLVAAAYLETSLEATVGESN